MTDGPATDILEWAILLPITFIFQRQSMRFDPAIAAHQSFTSAEKSCELGDDLDEAREAEATFSATAGDEAKAAYRTLQAIGNSILRQRRFRSFLFTLLGNR